MNPVKFFTYILAFVLAISFASCDGSKKEEISKKDSLEAVRPADSSAMLSKKNTYLIEPPDTSYTGEYIDKYDNGNVKFRGWFRFGKRHGQWMAFYANGILWSECYYDKGLRNGANNVYYENGLPNYKGWYKNDQRDSLWIFYDPYGNEIRRAMYKDDDEIPPGK